MGDTSIQIPSSSEVSFGRTAPSNAPAIALESILSDDVLNSLQPTSAEPSLREKKQPRAVDNLAYFENWYMFGNNNYSNCVAVAWANMRRVVTTRLSAPFEPSQSDVDRVFAMRLQGNVASTSVPTSSANGGEDGMDIQSLLNKLRKEGGPDGVKPVAFARIKADRPDLIRAAIEIYGCVILGIYVHQDHEGIYFPNNDCWPGAWSASVKRHAVVAGGYTPNLKIVTWGKPVELRDSFWDAIKGGKNIEEAWAVIWPEHLQDSSFNFSVDISKLKSAFEDVTGSRVVFDSALRPIYAKGDLTYMKTSNTASGKFELYRISAAKQYQNTAIKMVTDFDVEKYSLNGVCLCNYLSVLFIRTKKTERSRIELSYADVDPKDPTKFESTVGPFYTAFDVSEANKGFWRVSGRDLYFIQTKYTNEGKVVVWRSMQKAKWELKYYLITDIPTEGAESCQWIISNDNLFCIGPMTGSDKVVVRKASAATNYRTSISMQTDVGAEGFEASRWTVYKGEVFRIYADKSTGKVILSKVRLSGSNTTSVETDALEYTTSIAAEELGASDNSRWLLTRPI